MSQAAESQGFTLFEMIIVLVVLSLAIGLVISRAPKGGGTIEVRGTATRMVQALRATRAEAIAANRDVLFGVDAHRHLYQVGSDPPQPWPADLAVQVQVGGQPSRGIFFSPDGSSTGGVLLLTAPTRRMAITVDWLTGHIAAAELPKDSP